MQHAWWRWEMLRLWSVNLKGAENAEYLWEIGIVTWRCLKETQQWICGLDRDQSRLLCTRSLVSRLHKRRRISWTDEQPPVSKRVPYYTEFRQFHKEQSPGEVTILQRTRLGRLFLPSFRIITVTIFNFSQFPAPLNLGYIEKSEAKGYTQVIKHDCSPKKMLNDIKPRNHNILKLLYLLLVWMRLQSHPNLHTKWSSIQSDIYQMSYWYN